MNNVVKLGLPLLIILIILTAVPACGDEIITIYGDDEPLQREAVKWDGEIFAPVRVLEELLDINLRWFGSLKLLQFSWEGMDFRLRAGDDNMQVDERVHKITPPRLVDDHLWVPVEDIMTVLNFSVAYNADENTLKIGEEPIIIEDVVWDREKRVLTLTAEDKFQYDIKEGLNFNLQVVGVNLHEQLNVRNLPGGLNWEDQSLKNYSLPGPVDYTETFTEDKFKVSFHFPAELLEVDYRHSMGQIRFEIMGEDIEYELVEGEEEHILYLKNVYPSERLNRIENLEWEYSPGENWTELTFKTEDDVSFDLDFLHDNLLVLDWTRDASIEEIKWFSEDGERQLEIFADRELEFDSFILEDPKRLVFDIEGAWLLEGSSSISIQEAGIQELRYSQFEPEKVRLVFDIDEYPVYDVLSKDDGHKLVINFTEPFPEFLGVEKEEGKERDRYHINLTGEAEYEVRLFNDPHRLLVDIEGAKISGNKEIAFNSNPVQGLRASQLSRDPDVVRVVFDLDYKPSYEIVSRDTSEKITIEFPRSPLAGRTIVVDPGHGGMDPGAVSPSGLFEKDVVLDISLKLKTLLKEAGAHPILTRDEDVFLSLRERAEITNQVNADAFISIHANSVARDVPEGTETYIVPHANSSTRFLAQRVQENVVSTLGLRDRGVKQKNYAVLAPLKMPGILLEVAFISNAREEKILRDEQWQEKIAEAILHGLIEFFSVDERREVR